MDDLARRREAEFQACTNRYQVDQLMDQWLAEDRELDLAKDRDRQRLESLTRRVHRLEAERAALIKALGEVIPNIVNRMLDKRQFASYRGIYDAQRAYDAGAMVTDRGSTWIATADAKPGERPSKAVCWRLAAKGNPDAQQFA